MKIAPIKTVFSPSVDGETIRAFVLFGILLAAIAGLAGNLAFRELDLRLQKMEAYVTSREFEMDRELGKHSR